MTDRLVENDRHALGLLLEGAWGETHDLMAQGPRAEFGDWLAVQQHQTLLNEGIGLASRAQALFGQQLGDPDRPLGRCVSTALIRASRVHACRSSMTIAAPFSPIMMLAALVLVDTMAGMIEASITRSPSIPLTFRRESTTARSSAPIRQVPEG